MSHKRRLEACEGRSQCNPCVYTPASSNKRRKTCIGKNLTLRRLSSRLKMRPLSMKLILGFISI